MQADEEIGLDVSGAVIVDKKSHLRGRDSAREHDGRLRRERPKRRAARGHVGAVVDKTRGKKKTRNGHMRRISAVNLVANVSLLTSLRGHKLLA